MQITDQLSIKKKLKFGVGSCLFNIDEPDKYLKGYRNKKLYRLNETELGNPFKSCQML